MPLPKSFGDRPQGAKFIGNRYLVKGTLGKGQFGVVYLVEDFSAGKSLKALKEVPMSSDQPEMFDEAIKESRVMTQLFHPHLVSMYDSFFLDSARFFISMEYCKGGNLDDLIMTAADNRRNFPELTVACWLTQLADALAYLHHRRILHRDVKTKNVFVLNDHEDPPVLKLGDFGVSRMLNFSSEVATTRIGTPYYIPPEIFTDGVYNHKADIWSLGCLMYEVALLHHPFVPAANLQDLIRKVISGYIDWSDWRYSTALLSLCQRLLQRDANSRPSASEVVYSTVLKDHIKIHRNRHASCSALPVDTAKETVSSAAKPIHRGSASHEAYPSYDDSLCSNGIDVGSEDSFSTLHANWIKLLRAQQQVDNNSLDETLKPM